MPATVTLAPAAVCCVGKLFYPVLIQNTGGSRTMSKFRHRPSNTTRTPGDDDRLLLQRGNVPGVNLLMRFTALPVHTTCIPPLQPPS